MILRLTLHLPEDLTYIRTTRLLSRCLLEDMKVSAGVIDDIEFIVGELCSNVIRHARSQAPHFLMTLEYYQPKVIIQIVDEGRGFAETTILPVGAVRYDANGEERHGGYGLSLVKSLADKVDFSTTDPQGTTVCVEKRLVYETEQDADRAARRDSDSSGGVRADRNPVR